MKKDWKFWEKSPGQGQNFFILEGSCITGVNFAEEDRGFLGKKKIYIIAAWKQLLSYALKSSLRSELGTWE